MTILFVLSSILVAKMLIRWRMRHLWAHGGGCSRFGGRPIDLGAPDDDDYAGFRGMPWRRSRRWARAARRANEAQLVRVSQRPPRADVATLLEMNQRQQQLFDEAMERARNWVEPEKLARTLAHVGQEPFDRLEVELLTGSIEITDDFEHLHHSLTAEQRARLRQVTAPALGTRA